MSSNAMNIVGVVGGNGYVGSQVVQHLIKHAHDGKVKLVLFYRAGRPIKVAQDVASENIETREIDLGWPLERLVEAVKGIHLCM